MTNEHDPILAQAEAEKEKPEPAESWDVPPLSLRSILLLEKIGSPFAQPAEPLLDDDGAIKLDPETQEPMIKPSATIPTLTEVVEAYYVLKNQDVPGIGALIDDPQKFQNCVLDMASKITPEKIPLISEGISRGMGALNDAAKAEGMGGESGPKDPAGPTAS